MCFIYSMFHQVCASRSVVFPHSVKFVDGVKYASVMKGSKTAQPAGSGGQRLPRRRTCSLRLEHRKSWGSFASQLYLLWKTTTSCHLLAVLCKPLQLCPPQPYIEPGSSCRASNNWGSFAIVV